MSGLNKFLLIRFSSVGDILLTSPLIRALRSRYPSAQIDFVVRDSYAELVKFNPHLSTVLEFHPQDSSSLRQLRQTIRAERYDAVLDLHRNFRSVYLRRFLWRTQVKTIDKRIIKRFAFVNFKWNFYGEEIVQAADRYLEVGEPFGVNDDRRGLEIFIPDEIIASVRARVERFGLTRYGQVVGLIPTARHFTKRWPAEHFVELGIKLGAQNQAKIFVLGGSDEREYCGDIAQMINAGVGAGVAENCAGQFSLLETAALFDYCDVVVTNDTGLMHLAAARQRKVVAIFGSTARELGFFPYRVPNIIVENKGLSCRPCTHIGRAACPEGHFRCMKDIATHEVHAALKSIVELREPHVH